VRIFNGLANWNTCGKVVFCDGNAPEIGNLRDCGQAFNRRIVMSSNGHCFTNLRVSWSHNSVQTVAFYLGMIDENSGRATGADSRLPAKA
jgi:hypothetical protein